MKHSLLWVFLVLFSSGSVFSQNQSEKLKTTGTAMSSEGSNALIGTWRVVEVADVDKDGKWEHFFGEPPRGYFVYDAISRS